jgi:hypothetical protein
MMFAQMAGYVWILGIALLMAGNHIFRLLGINEPSWYQAMTENKLACFMGLFIINSIGTSMMTSGAFEVILNDEHVVFSRLKSGGQMPSGDDIVRGLQSFGLEPH